MIPQNGRMCSARFYRFRSSVVDFLKVRVYAAAIIAAESYGYMNAILKNLGAR